MKICSLTVCRFRSVTPKTRVIPLSLAFLEYLRSDGIVLPSDDSSHDNSPDETNSVASSDSASTTAEIYDEESDPSSAWKELHDRIKATIAELGGSVVPKLNWSAPKDATWISATNNMECQVPNDIYLLLKSSDFISHDLDHAFDDCEDGDDSDWEYLNETRTTAIHEYKDHNNISEPGYISQPSTETPRSSRLTIENFPYHLVLRKTISAMITSLEFRCFVHARKILCICQRDLNYYDFLAPLVPKLLPLVQNFFDTSLKDTFPDENFVFDIYIPPPHARVWLIDINPWAPRTDPLLFSWLEILELTERVQEDLEDIDTESEDNGSESDVAFTPEFRLVGRDDPEALNFNSPQYSAHKLPKDVVDASLDGGAGIRDFMTQWREILASQVETDD